MPSHKKKTKVLTDHQLDLLKNKWPMLTFDNMMTTLCDNTLWGADCYGSTRCGNWNRGIYHKICSDQNFLCDVCNFMVCACCNGETCPLCGPKQIVFKTLLSCFKHNSNDKYTECPSCDVLLCSTCDTPCPYCNLINFVLTVNWH